MTFARIQKAWNRFFYEPHSGESLALVRIGLGLIFTLYFIGLYSNFDMWIGPNGVISVETFVHLFPKMRWTADFFVSLQHSPVKQLFFLGSLYLSVSLMVGFRPRISAGLMYVLWFLLRSDEPVTLREFSGNEIPLFLLILLTFADSGAAFSVDRWLEKRRDPSAPPRMISPFAERMLQIHMSFAYISCVVAKGNGPDWHAGSVVYYGTRSLLWVKYPPPYLSDMTLVLQAMTWGTLFCEGTAGTLVWFRKTRYFALLVGAIFHLSLDTFLNLPFFQFIMLLYYAAWMDPADVRACVEWAKRKGGRLFSSFRRSGSRREPDLRSAA